MKRLAIIAAFMIGIWLLLQGINSDNVVEEPIVEEVIEEIQEEEPEVIEEEPEEEEEEEEVDDLTRRVRNLLSRSERNDAEDEDSEVVASDREVGSPTPVEAFEPAMVEEITPQYPNNKAVKVYLYEWGLDVMTDGRLYPGTVDFRVTNTGRFTHSFAIEGGDHFGDVVPNDTRTFSAEVGPGDLVIYSPHVIDTSKGMEEVLRVSN